MESDHRALVEAIQRVAGCSEPFAEELALLIKETPVEDQLDVLCSHTGAGSGLREQFAMLLEGSPAELAMLLEGSPAEKDSKETPGSEEEVESP